MNAVKHCLETVEADVQLSGTSLDAVREAKYYVDQCFEGGPAYYDIESTMNWVQQQDYQIFHEVSHWNFVLFQHRYDSSS